MKKNEIVQIKNAFTKNEAYIGKNFIVSSGKFGASIFKKNNNCLGDCICSTGQDKGMIGIIFIYKWDKILLEIFKGKGQIFYGNRFGIGKNIFKFK